MWSKWKLSLYTVPAAIENYIVLLHVDFAARMRELNLFLVPSCVYWAPSVNTIWSSSEFQFLVLWDIVVHQWLNGSKHVKAKKCPHLQGLICPRTLWNLQMRTLLCLKMSVSKCPLMQHHIPQEQKPLVHCYRNLKTCTHCICWRLQFTYPVITSDLPAGYSTWPVQHTANFGLLVTKHSVFRHPWLGALNQFQINRALSEGTFHIRINVSRSNLYSKHTFQR